MKTLNNDTTSRGLECLAESQRLIEDIADELIRNNDYEPHSPEFYQAAATVLEDGAFLGQWFDGKGYTDAEELAITENAYDRAQSRARCAAMTDIELAREYDAHYTDYNPKQSAADTTACLAIHQHRWRTSAAYNELYTSGKYKIQTPTERSAIKRQRDKRALANRTYDQMTDRGLGDALAKQYVTLIQSDNDEQRRIADELKTGIEIELTRRIRNAGVERHYRPRTMPA